MNLDGVKNIIFDLGGVILNIDYLKTEKAFKNLGILNFDEIYSQAKQTNLFNDLETGKIGENEFCEKLNSLTDSNFSNKEIIECWNAMLLDLPKERIELLNNLKSKFRIFLLSNTNEIHLKAFNKTIKDNYKPNLFNELFENHYFSHSLKMRKPHPETFTKVLELNNLKASETFFIDDSIQHIEGANKAGLKTYFLTPDEDILSLFSIHT